MQRLRLNAALDVQMEANRSPAPGLAAPEVLTAARSGFFEVHMSVDWQQAYQDQMRTADRVPQTTATSAEMATAK